MCVKYNIFNTALCCIFLKLEMEKILKNILTAKIDYN